MMSPRLRTALAVLIFLSIPLAAAWAKPADSHDADSAAIKKLAADFTAAFNSHDSHAVAAAFTDDADFINVAGMTTHGKSEIDQHFVPLFAGRLKTAHREVSVRNIRFLGPADMATVVIDYDISGAMDPNGAAAPPSKGLYDWIVTKQNGRWLIVVLHESNLPAPAPPAPAK